MGGLAESTHGVEEGDQKHELYKSGRKEAGDRKRAEETGRGWKAK